MHMDEYKKIIETASDFLKINEYFEAAKLYEKALHICPLDYKGWWGAAKALMLLLFSWDIKKFVDNYYKMNIGAGLRDIPDYYNKALGLAVGEERKLIEREYNLLINEYCSRWDEISLAIREGNIEFFEASHEILFFIARICGLYYDEPIPEEFKKTKLYQSIVVGKKNAEVLRNIPMYKRGAYNDVSGVWPNDDILFAAEKILIEDDRNVGIKRYTLKIDADKIVDEGDKLYNYRRDNGKCLMCGGSVRFFGKRCKICGHKQL